MKGEHPLERKPEPEISCPKCVTYRFYVGPLMGYQLFWIAMSLIISFKISESDASKVHAKGELREWTETA